MKPTITKVVSFDSTKDLVTYLDEMQHASPQAIFRGHSDANWPLTPSAWRPGSIVERAKDRFIDEIGNGLIYMIPTDVQEKWVARNEFSKDVWEEKLIQLAAWLCAEQQVIEDFCALCDSVALPVPGYVAPTVAELIRGSGHESVPIRSYGSAHAFAQHFGVPTRLLDFSESSLKALYFAVSGIGQPGLLDLPRPRFSVVAASPNLLDLGEYMEEKGRAVQAKRVLRSEIPRLHAQDGLFLFCNERANHWFLMNDAWPSLDQLTKNWKFEIITGPPDGAQEVLARLRRNGIDEVHMKPSYETAAVELNRQTPKTFSIFG